MERKTTIEMLLIVGVVLLVLFFAAVAVSSARSKTRDVTRLAHVRLIQSALEDFFNESNTYPISSDLPLGDPTGSACLGTDGFAANCSGQTQIFLRSVPSQFEKALDGLSVCGKPARDAFCYNTQGEGQSYGIQFELEHDIDQVSLKQGRNCAIPEGMKVGDC